MVSTENIVALYYLVQDLKNTWEEIKRKDLNNIENDRSQNIDWVVEEIKKISEILANWLLTIEPVS